MDLAYLITGIILLVYLVLVWMLGGWLQLKSPDIWVLRGGLALIGIAPRRFRLVAAIRSAAAGGAPSPSTARMKSTS